MADKTNGLNNECIDVLKEIANIGSGNAASALANMLDNTIEISVPAVSFVDINKAVEMIGGYENIVVSVLARMSGDINGIILYILNPDSAKDILKLIGLDNSGIPESISEMELSALTETGNIIISSYINSIAGLCEMKIMTNVPSVCIDMVGAVISEPMVEISGIADKMLFIKNDFLSSQGKITANMLLLPDMCSLPKLLNRLGIEI